MSSVRNVIIIGSGPAGLTAAIYAARANLQPLCIAGYQAGGQLMITSEVENYPGFPHGVTGPELMEQFRKQAERFGTEFVDKDVTKVELHGAVKKVYVEDTVYEARAIIIATGASAMWLGLENEKRLQGRGVSACATCDGFFFRGKKIAVVGGGDTAMEEATFLTRFAEKVTIIHRRDEFRASKIMQERALSNPKIEVMWNTEVKDILGKETIEGLTLYNNKTKQTTQMPIEGLFIAIGHKPNTDLFKGQLEINDKGYLCRSVKSMASVPGVFVAGDVYDFRYRQAITAAGSGCEAAIDCERWLEAHGHGDVKQTPTEW
ncbi:MAG TPA: thioredoxin-disulfide reductase [Candidatus Thermoplasmatota archaeon]|nr:thioredoxin-disulfide reductase [Candidatus Thermoplasmatota archaeon]